MPTFADRARRALSRRFAMPLEPAQMRGMPRPFDLASEDGALLGIALAPTRSASRTLTTLERAELSEAVLQLSLAPTQQRVLVVGCDAARLAPWLAVYGHLAQDVEFWRLRDDGKLARLEGSVPERESALRALRRR